MNPYVLGFQEIDKTKLAIVGGKGANLGELSRINGIIVPEGFCITTEAYKKIIGNNNEFNSLLSELSLLNIENIEKIGEISGKIRKVIEEIEIPKDIDDEITFYLSKFGERHAYAVRSSATAEDLPTASFAGQQDTYLNIMRKPSILKHISKCWASLFTDRAVIYRMQNDFDHSKVQLSVVIQKMVFPQAAGIMFTADPITSNRKIVSIDASFGLGEALVSGLVNSDIYKVQENKIIDKKISAKKLAIYALKEGGTEEIEITGERQNMQTLTDDQILQLSNMGRKIESYFGRPQDIEWCLYDDKFYVVQSRPITTLYPTPQVNDNKNHVYLSFAHRQMMTEAMRPLGLSFFQIFFKQFGIQTNMPVIGGRLYMDISHDLASPIARKLFISGLDKVDVLMKSALINLQKRKEYLKSLPKGKTSLNVEGGVLSFGIQMIKEYLRNDPAFVEKSVAENQALLRNKEKIFSSISGEELFAFIVKDMKDIKAAMFKVYGAYFAGSYASDWINKNMKKWLGEKSVADTLAQSVLNNVTSEMGLELLDVADVIRQYPAVIEYLENAKRETFFEDLSKIDGGNIVSDSIHNYLKKYGMRCSGEIDITRTRWNEDPMLLVPLILSNIKNFEPNAHSAKFDQGLLEAKQKEAEILSRLKQLPGGNRKLKKTKKVISVLRNFAGYREYNKYLLICYFWIVKQALLKEAETLKQDDVIKDIDDIYYLTFDELKEAVKTKHVDYSIITKRKEEYEIYKKLTPPRIMTSDGEIISGEYDTGNMPKGAIAGTPVSSGIVEGRARVILNINEAKIEEGDILITKFTDPSWTPIFVLVKGLVTEVGGMMTHGAVVAREYGLPAVAGVDDATKLIKDGQRIRINGTEGYIEIL
ncbi:pyruvate,water dikinase [Clostridium beijerinckii]|uniref:phosphoenolpyruvate synthase n=1 Tax=Clostridium beijerinckii TaxID=1520 RepID=UPI00156E20FE|nr:phosphoenolpyruvate synthase [Clostridium beijerinckii]NRT34502.1 pyruvate,water dikinase [Clostridium beijerinckii]NRT46067.1 pyruvate,water dikinase [Clostridium beijerinckii]NRZ19931.1 pyruvate,water dikinase [Clostridium beijerinckii]